MPVGSGPAAAQAGGASGNGVVVIANGWSPPDVGAAAPLAGRLDAAVLYASKDELGQPTIDALEQLDPSRVLLMGGPAALTSAVQSQVRRVLGGARVERFSGADRVDTAARAALSAPAVPAGRPVVIANGWSPSDVGTAAPLAASLGGSVLFARRDSLGAPTVNALGRLAPSRIIVVGGTAALRPGIESQIASVVPGVRVERLAGTDRVDTAARGAARAAVELGEPVVLANGWEPADVSIAAPLAAALDGSVLFTQRNSLGARTARALSELVPSRIILVGGSERLAATLAADLERLHPTTPRVNIAGPDRIATAALAALFGVQVSAEQQRFEEAVATIAPGEADCDAWQWDLDDETDEPINWRETPNAVNAFSLPAGFDTVIAVGAVGRDGNLSDFSTVQDYVYIAAPGGSHSPGILSTVPLLTCVTKTHPEAGSTYWAPNGCGIDDPPAECTDTTTPDPDPFNEPAKCAHHVGYASGTSMASPFVAGVVAHMLNRYPEATPEQVRLALAESAQDQGAEGRDPEYGHGLVQPLAAIERLGEILAGATPEPGVTVNPLRLDIEQGPSGSYTIALDSEPAGTVRVSIDLSARTDVRAAPSSLVFTPENFWVPQTVTVTVPVDPTGTGQPFAALHTAAGGGYDDVEIANVAIIVRSEAPAPSLESLSLWSSSCDPVTSGLVLFSSCGSVTSPALATDPLFDPERLTYTASVAVGTRFVTIDAGPADGAEMRSLSPKDADPGMPGHQVRLDEPVNIPSSDRADKPGTSAAVGERFLEVVGSDWSGAVIVASSENFPDGLAAASLAGALRAPILLTPKNRLDPAIASFVRDNDVSEIVIMGGTAAVSQAVQDELDEILGHRGWTSRLWGQDRYQTALRIAERVVQDTGTVGELCGPDEALSQRAVFIATGRGSADALTASPAAYATKMPVLLVDPNARALPGGVRDFIRTHDVATAVILGGTSAVPECLQRELSQLGSINQVTGVAGADRYATASRLAQDITAHCYDGGVETIALANGRGFADALAAGPLTAELQGVMLLTGPDDVPPATLDAMTQIGKEAQLTNITLALLAIGDIAQAENAVTDANTTAGQQLHGQPALGPVSAIAAGGTASCAIKTDGAVQCWGDNSHGQRDAPSGKFTAIAVGTGYVCGIRTDGTVRCWGRSEFSVLDPPSGQFRTEAPSQPEIDTPPLTGAVESISVPASDTPQDVQVTLTVTYPQDPTTTTTYQITIRQD